MPAACLTVTRSFAAIQPMMTMSTGAVELRSSALVAVVVRSPVKSSVLKAQTLRAP